MVGFDATKGAALDWVVGGAGLLAYISSFLPWYSYSVSVSIFTVERSATANVNAWNAGFGAWFSVLLLVVAGGVVLASMMGVRLPAARPLITLSLSALAFVTILLRWVTFSDTSSGHGDLGNIHVGGFLAASSGAGFGLYVGLIAAIAAVVASFLTLRAAGGSPGQPSQASSSTPPPTA
jgi:hypothetical protein